MAQERIFTIEDIYDLPDGTRAELIDGQIYDMTPPNRKHQEIVRMLIQKIANFIDHKGGPCEVYPAPFAVFLNEDDINYVEPDVSVIFDPGKLNDKGCSGAPDWIIEVVSPSSRQLDYSTKLFKYRSAGVQEYWIVDPDKARITVWNFKDDNTEEYTFLDSMPVNIYDDFSIDFSKLEL